MHRMSVSEFRGLYGEVMYSKSLLGWRLFPQTSEHVRWCLRLCWDSLRGHWRGRCCLQQQRVC